MAVSLAQIADQAMRRGVIGNQLGICPFSKESIDIRNARFILNEAGDPVQAISKSAYDAIKQRQGDGLETLSPGYRLEA